MKKNFIFLYAMTFALILLSCRTNPKTMLGNTESRHEIISTLVNDSSYRAEIRDSMRIYMNNGGMMGNMMGMKNNMMQMMKQDSSFQNSMMHQMMMMAEGDSMMCSKMIKMMRTYPNVMKQMNRMKENPKEEEHSQHHD